MAKKSNKSRKSSRGSDAKYDANNVVLDKTYGALADLRRQLSDSKEAVAQREQLLETFSKCTDSQRAWLLLEDYFERLSLSRKDFAGDQWWERLQAVKGKKRLEELAIQFLRSARPLPSELLNHADFDRLAEIEEQEKQQEIVEDLEAWLLPRAHVHLDSPRANLDVLCQAVTVGKTSARHRLAIEFHLFRPRTGSRERTLAEVVELANRSAHEQELYSVDDWDFIKWLADCYRDREDLEELDGLQLGGMELIQWLTRWGSVERLGHSAGDEFLEFHGELAHLKPDLKNHDTELSFTQKLNLPDGGEVPLDEVTFFDGQPLLALVKRTFYLVRNAPPPALIDKWLTHPEIPVRRLSHRLLTHLRKTQEGASADWAQLCETHTATPQFVFELADEVVRLRLKASSDRDDSLWEWNGHEWQREKKQKARKTGRNGNGNHNHNGKPEILDDPRLDPAIEWLRRMDWFTPEPGLWVGDANSAFLNTLAEIWPDRPKESEYLGNPAFQRLFLGGKPIQPKLMLKGSGIDWLSVSAEWEQESLKLSKADLERLRTASGRFVKLPDSGWVELDVDAVQSAHEAMADLGIDGLANDPQKVDLLHASQADEMSLAHFAKQPRMRQLKKRLSDFKGIPAFKLPKTVQADMRPYQKSGFDFLCHLSSLQLGGVLADDMGLGKTLQTLSWLAWLKAEAGKRSKPALVICPASVLHNWRRESEKFTANMKVLVLESGSARHNLRARIPEHDIIITNYALLRRDLDALNKFEFGAIIVDEAQYIKNPSAQVTRSVKQLRGKRRLALTGTPLENRMLDLWSIVDFVQPGYLGNQAEFNDRYDPKGEEGSWERKTARRRLSARLRPIMLRRLKSQVAKDLPDRIEERRDCELIDDQRQLYLAELRRSRDKVMKTVKEKGLAKSKMHVLAALTRLRQICCHPALVGNDSVSGKTETLFELLEPLLAEGQKVLIFSQFVQMLRLLEDECVRREIPSHILTGETKNRQDVVNAFQDDPNPSVFLLSLRAAGTGLNLTTASYVVLYDPWWNPAVEAQAIDRSHRIGQTRNVIAYKLIAPGTVEEKIWDLQQSKSQTIKDVLGEEGFAKSLSKTDLDYLFSEG